MSEHRISSRPLHFDEIALERPTERNAAQAAQLIFFVLLPRLQTIFLTHVLLPFGQEDAVSMKVEFKPNGRLSRGNRRLDVTPTAGSTVSRTHARTGDTTNAVQTTCCRPRCDKHQQRPDRLCVLIGITTKPCARWRNGNPIAGFKLPALPPTTKSFSSMSSKSPITS